MARPRRMLGRGLITHYVTLEGLELLTGTVIVVAHYWRVGFRTWTEHRMGGPPMGSLHHQENLFHFTNHSGQTFEKINNVPSSSISRRNIALNIKHIEH